MARLRGLLLDLDGTLVDSNGFHLDAWHQAFVELGHRVSRARIRVEIGKGGDQLVRDLLGEAVERDDGAALRSAHDRLFEARIRHAPLRVFPGAPTLMGLLRAHDLRTSLATSSKRRQLALVERACGVPWRKLVDETTTASDVEHSKPHPDLVHAAAHKLGLRPSACALLGDTPWDAQAARRAGARAIGISGGGNSPGVLRRAGAGAVVRDVASLLHRLPRVLAALK